MKHEVYTVNVEVQTPVHVGSGETVNALSYLRVKDMLYVIDDDRWQRWLEAQNVTSRFLQWMDSVAQVMGTPQQRQMSLTRFLTDSLRRQDVEVVAKQVAAYPLRMEECGEPDAVRGLKAHLRDARRRAYLPGSSLKGVIRTALLEDLLLDDDHLNRYLQQPLQQRLKTAAGDRRRLRREVREVWQQMEQALLRGGKQKANFDLLRFVMVSDSEPFQQEQVSLRLVRSEGTNRPTHTWLEMVRAGASTRFTLTLLPDAPLKPLGLDDELGEYLLWETLFEVLYERGGAQVAARTAVSLSRSGEAGAAAVAVAEPPRRAPAVRGLGAGLSGHDGDGAGARRLAAGIRADGAEYARGTAETWAGGSASELPEDAADGAAV
jgi:hypothetical protein